VNSDGNCFFRAVADQLGKGSAKHADVRADVMQYIVDHKVDFAAFVEDDEDFVSYVARMRRVRGCCLAVLPLSL
jgi:OTU domain-containing protein 3